MHAAKRMAMLEQRWFRTHRLAEIARAQLAAHVELVDVQLRLERAEQLKHRIMHWIEAVEDTLLQDSNPVVEHATQQDLPAKP
jgi:hypothetical protein